MKIEKIVIGSDHAGYDLKLKVIDKLESKGIMVKDVGTYSTDSCDYPTYADAVCKAIQLGEFEMGILICGTGIGMSIAANKHAGIRAACCSDIYSAKLTRQHNNANVLCLGGRVVSPEKAVKLVDLWFTTPFEGDRHNRRLAIIAEMDERK